MLKLKTMCFVLLALVLLVACGENDDTLTPLVEALATQAAPPRAGAVPVASAQFPQGLSTEPLAVVTTQPADKAEEVTVAKDLARIVVQFNHPVVPLVGVEQQKGLPQPLTVQPSLVGVGVWLNTSTFAFLPGQDLDVAVQYTVTLAPLKDMLGQSLNGFKWSFKTASPAILKTYPSDNTQFVSVSQPISITFNTTMDRPSTESRLAVKRNDNGTAVAGKFEWLGANLRFIPNSPLDYGVTYSAQVKSGAQDANKTSATIKDAVFSFQTVDKPGIRSTNPKDGTKSAKLENGFRVDFNSPMKQDSLKITVQPTITQPTKWWESDRGGSTVSSTVVHFGDIWEPSKAYTVTISGDSVTRDGEKLGKDVVVRFTTAPRDPELYLNVPSTMGMYDSNAPQTMVATYVNLNQIDYKLYKIDRADYVGLIGRDMYTKIGKYTPKDANLQRAWSLKPQAVLNTTRLISTTLTADSTPLAAGVYLLAASTPITGTASAPRPKHLLVVSGLNLALKRTETEALVWVTSLKTGLPTPDQPLTLLDMNGKQLATGKSDKDGIWRTKFASQNAWDPIYVLSESSGQIVGAVGSDWSDGILTWDFNMPSQFEAEQYYANLYTDRAIYRPGQTVYFRGILRKDNDAQYSLPQGLETVPVNVRDGQGKQISTQNVTLSRFGTLNGEIKLGDSASIGFYNLSIVVGKDPNSFTSSVGFQVAEYRAPEFQVTTKTDKAEYFNGDQIQVDVNSTYFFGGPVANAPVTWRLLSDDLFFTPDNVKGYWSFTDYDLTEQRQRQGGVISEGKGKTDASGLIHFQVKADLKDFPLSQNFTLEAEITDVNNQSVSSRTVVPVHQGRYYIGMRSQRYIGAVNQDQAVDLITVDTKGAPVANTALAVSFYSHEWFSVREKRDDGGYYWRSSYKDTLVSKVSATTDAQGATSAKFKPAKGGVYKIVAEGQDSSKNSIRSATYVWVSGADFVNWRMENNDRIDLVTDKKEYAPGDTAEVLVPSPFKNAEALLTIERGTIREARRITLTSNSDKIKIPIPADYAPNVYVSIFIVKGRGPDSPTPQFKLGYTNLAVSTVEKQLKIALTPDKTTHYGPGDKATFNVQVTDSTNKPVESELSLALVDKAIQSLADDASVSPLQAFYQQRGLGVQTSSTLVRSVERVNQTLTPEAKGGGGGLLDKPVRRDFRDTAFWKADVVTDASGRAQVSMPLPDNLTTWNLTAKGVTASTQVGDAHADIVSTKDLLVRPVLPRFFVVGDKVRLEAVVNNNSDKNISADVRIDANGLVLGKSSQQPLTINAHDKAKVGWDTTISAVDQVTVKFSVAGGGLDDALEQSLPVLRPISSETVATAGQVDTKVIEQIQLPQAIDKTAGQLKIDVSPSLAAASRDSLKFLQSFDYECTEQTVSKFFPNVASYLALKKLGIDRPTLQSGLEANVSQEVQRLYSLQREDGGWGWWSDDASQPVLTAYALLGLFKARDAGFAVDRDVMNRAEQFLNRTLDKPLDVKQPSTFNDRAFVLFVLTEIGRNNTGRVVSLFDQRTNLNLYGKAFLLMTLQGLKQPQAQTLVTELSSVAIPSATGAHWEEAKPDYWSMNTNTRSTALVIMALSRSSPQSPLLPNAVRWLMVARKEGHWSTTQETAWSVLSLTEYMLTTGELQGNYSYSVTVNGKALGDGKVDQTNIDQTKSTTVAIKDLVSNAANEIVLTRGTGDGRLYYSAYLNYYLPVENMVAQNKGIIVARQYEAVDPQTLKPTGKLLQSAKVGDYVQVTLTLIAPTDLHYLALEDPLPAGFEAVDTTLKTASAAAASPGLKQTQPVVDKWFQPYWMYWAHSEVRDDKVAAFATYLGRGTYEYSYMMRASVAGEFRSLPTRAWEMYFPDVYGRSAGATITVQP